MQWEVLISGTGGQGVMLAGELLSRAALIENKYASCLPSYGPEMRGGTANCTSIVSEEEILTPLIDRPSAAIILNQLSYNRFKAAVAPGGVMFINSSRIGPDYDKAVQYTNIIALPFSELAKDMGNELVANIIALGAYIRFSGAVKEESLIMTLQEQLKKRQNLLSINTAAVKLGMEKMHRFMNGHV